MAPKAAPKKESKGKKAEQAAEENAANKVSPPDKKKYEDARAEIAAEITKFQDKLKKLSSRIAERSTGKDEFYAKKAELRDQQKRKQDMVNSLQEQKSKILEQMKGQKAAVQANRAELKTMQKSMQYQSEEQIDQQIATIEFKLHTETMPLKEEKKLLEEIKQLKKDKPRVHQVNAKRAEVDAASELFTSSADAKGQLDELTAAINTIRDGKKEISEQLDQLVKEREAQQGDLPDLFKQRDELNGQIRDQIRLRDEKQKEYREQERIYNDWQREQRDARLAAQNAERHKRDAERDEERKKYEIEKLDDQPHTHEMTLLAQTIRFCESLTKKEDQGIEEKKEVAYDNPDTHVVLLSKNQREEEYWYAPTTKKSKKTKSKQAATTIKHNAATFKLFADLKLEPPLKTDDIPATLAKLQEEMEKYRVKVKEWEENREEKKKQIMLGQDAKDDDEGKAEDAPQEAPQDD